jgi:alkylation response protein AidB-like acyl-CoA dehydrogenase
VARARIDIDMTRLLCLKAADMMDKVGNKAAKQEIAMIKVQAPNMALKIIDDAIQAHGGGGVSNDYGLANAYAHQRTLRLADGPDEVHARSIARMEFGKHVPEEGPTANALRGGAKAANDAGNLSSGDMGVAR